ncbi:MAG: tetratricopeptide repeat protein [Planctomycetota bacterium]
MNLTTRRLSLLALAPCALAGMTFLAGCQTWGQVKDEVASPYLDLRSNLILQMAESHFEAGQLEIAQKHVNDATKIDPTNPKLYLMDGRIALERGQLERAMKLFEVSIQFDEQAAGDSEAALAQTNPDPHHFQGVIYQRWQRYDEALEAYGKAFALERDNPGHLMAMAGALVPLERTDEAIALLEEQRTYFDQSSALRASLGHLYRLQGNHRKAVRAFEEAVTLQPENAKLREELALSQAAAGDHADAASNLRIVIEDPDSRDRLDLHRLLAQSQIADGQINAARQTLINLTRRYAAEPDDWVNLAKLAWREKDYSATLFAAHNVTQLAPDRPEGYLLAGMVWQHRGNDVNALRMFDRAAELDVDDATPLVLRGVVLQRSGKPEAAALAYREALQRQPADPRAKRLLASVEVQ